MVQTHSISSESEFISYATALSELDLTEPQAAELWELWEAYDTSFTPAKLIVIPEWFAESEFNARRPLIVARVEYDDASSNAVLFSQAQLIDISFVENEVLTQAGDVSVTRAVEQLDISETNDYIDEPGKVWIPRSQMTVFEKQ